MVRTFKVIILLGLTKLLNWTKLSKNLAWTLKFVMKSSSCNFSRVIEHLIPSFQDLMPSCVSSRTCRFWICRTTTSPKSRTCPTTWKNLVSPTTISTKLKCSDLLTSVWLPSACPTTKSKTPTWSLSARTSPTFSALMWVSTSLTISETASPG